MQNLCIIDTIGPFVLKTEGETVNWSKVPFARIEKEGRLSASARKQITTRFETYIASIRALGYNSISIDDLAHMAALPCYPPHLLRLLQDYHVLYRHLFSIAKRHGMKVFINTDYLFFNKSIENYLQTSGQKPDDFFLKSIEKTVHDFPEIDGIILRIGENDGKDVRGAFLSKLVLKTPQEVNKLLQKILPAFETHKKTLIFRTWTVGVYKIGDLIWNQATFDTVFSSVKSNALIISMKFGDTDFMRYLHLNPLFFHGPHKKIIELQTRREWEGMGTLASFVGWDYEKYLKALQTTNTFAGIHVWCQTGGWAKVTWTNLSYLKNSSFWNELNTEVTIALYQGKTANEAIEQFCKKRSIKDTAAFTQLLELSEITIKKGLYISEIAKKQLYFRRTRIPPLLWIEWDKAPLQPVVISLLRVLVTNPPKAIQEADEAALASKEMLRLGKALSLDSSIITSLEFHYATFILFAQLRRYIFMDISPNEVDRLNKAIRSYQNTHLQHFKTGTLKVQRSKKNPHRVLISLLRQGATYRKRDRLLLVTSPLQRWLVRYYLRRSGSHLADQSMGVEALFK